MLMGSIGEVSGIVTARRVLDQYTSLNSEEKLSFFQSLEQNFNADLEQVSEAYTAYAHDPTSANLNTLARTAEPRRHELLRRLNQTPGATHDLVAMRTDLLALLQDHPELKSVDEVFVRMFTSWFGRGFLTLQTIDWDTSAAILERIIRYEAVHQIEDWDDLRSRIDPPNRRCFAFFHPALIDEPLIFVEVALGQEIPSSINEILNNSSETDADAEDYKTAAFYSISNCQPGLKNISFGNFLIKQVVQELQSEFPSIKSFVTLSPIPGFDRWLTSDEPEESTGLKMLKTEVRGHALDAAVLEQDEHILKQLVFSYLIGAKRGIYPADPVARFHLGNGASIHQINIGADTSDNGLRQSRGAMVNYLYDFQNLERNHESYITEGEVHFNDKLKSLLIKD